MIIKLPRLPSYSPLFKNLPKIQIMGACKLWEVQCANNNLTSLCHFLKKNHPFPVLIELRIILKQFSFPGDLIFLIFF